jgi:uncharacterized protein
MSGTSIKQGSAPGVRASNGSGGLYLYCALTVVLTVGVLFLLPGMAGPAVVVFIPAIMAIVLVTTSAGWHQVVPQLFSRAAWRIDLKWAVITLGVGLALRLGVSLLGALIISEYRWQPDLIWPFLLVALLFAAGEEVGWRGFALPALLARGYRPLAAALLLGVPWALLHVPLLLPCMLSAGTPLLAQFVTMMALSVLVTWAYLAGGRSLSAAVLLHGGQNFLSTLNNGLNPVASGWLMAVIYLTAALLIIIFTKGRLGQRGAEPGTA